MKLDEQLYQRIKDEEINAELKVRECRKQLDIALHHRDKIMYLKSDFETIIKENENAND